jgi:hypothetical protein
MNALKLPLKPSVYLTHYSTLPATVMKPVSFRSCFYKNLQHSLKLLAAGAIEEVKVGNQVEDQIISSVQPKNGLQAKFMSANVKTLESN